ncbi:hypothetical protein BDQ17DRAFT_1402009 [Cyathus striatus]|nr:hypothetical protein BDQ17DRAFT_1402009 [Cyathus striatus]
MITFYDIPSTLPGKAWSPNTWKIRYCLNYKGLEYKTEWIEYPDIEAVSKKLSIHPTDYQEDGSPYYTLPAIYDSSTGVVLANSFDIAKYLDVTYPETRPVLPEGTQGLQNAFITAFSTIIPPVRPFILPKIAAVLSPRSEEYYTRTRTIWFGKNLQDIVPQGGEREQEWGKFQKNLSKASEWFENNGGKGPYLMGDTISFADFVLAGYLLYLKISWGEESTEWKDIKSWDNGQWDNFVDEFKKYETVH